MIRFGNCTPADFIALCDRRGIQGIDRDNWVRLFKRCANVSAKPKESKRQQRIVVTFIAEGRALDDAGDPIAMPRIKPRTKSKPNRKK